MRFLDNDKVFKGVQVLLFSFLFIYVLLRIIFVETLHDEVATYMFYFYQGDFWGPTIQWDANNHLLNSFVGHYLYKVFGDHFFVLRLPNLIAFIFYFWGVAALLKFIRSRSLQLIGLFGITSIPFILEYFGNARGYGLSLGFFVWGLYFAIQHLRSFQIKRLIFAYCFLILAVAANLTLIISSGMIAAILFLHPLISKQSRKLFPELVVHLLFGLSILPFFIFGMKLRKAGALYYGSLDGLWDVTGKTLSRYVLFFDADWLMYVIIGLLLALIVGVFIAVKRESIVEKLKQPANLYLILVMGNLLVAYLSAVILLVNYPEDRTAMYLVPLILLITLFLLDTFKMIKFLQWLFLFFPITLLFNLNLETSVFSPDDRLNDEFYAEVKKHITPVNTVMIYPIMNWNWPYHESHSEVKASVAQFDNPNSDIVDILVTKTTILNNPNVSLLYDTIAYHAPSTYIAFKRKTPLQRVPLDSTTVIEAKGNLEFVELGVFDLSDQAEKDLVLSVRGHLKTIAPNNKIQLIVSTNETQEHGQRYLYYSFETTYQSQLIDDEFLHHFILENINSEEKEIKVYLWNRALHLVEVSGASCNLFELKSAKNGVR